MKPETKVVHAVRDHTTSTGAVTVPIYQTSTFSHPGVGRSTGYDYSRTQNPTREHAEKTVAALEGAAEALAFSSGMAAVSALMELFSPGDEIIATEDLYGGSIRLFNNISSKNGVIIKYADTSNSENVKSALSPHTAAIFIETPTNPMMRVTDITEMRRISDEYDGGKHIHLIVDNTFSTPYFCNPITLGADIVLHSGTKYLGGHNDTLAGFLAAASPETAKKLRFIQNTVGSVLSPTDAFLITRGIKTLAIRMERSEQNAIKVAAALRANKKVTAVHYTGLPDHPQYELTKKQTSGFGSMISFSVESEDTAKRILENVKIILFAESLGGVETLITYPFTQTHADVPIAERRKRGIDENLLRLSVGIENADDLIEDLSQAIG